MSSSSKLNAYGLYIRNHKINEDQLARRLKIPKTVLFQDMIYNGNVYNKSVKFYYALADISGVSLDEIIEEIRKLDDSLKIQREGFDGN